MSAQTFEQCGQLAIEADILNVDVVYSGNAERESGKKGKMISE